MKYLLPLAAALLLTACSGGRGSVSGENWTLGPITRLDDYNPVLGPDDRPDFFCPVRRDKLRWEARAVYNPAAIVRDRGVWMLYRGQDNRGTSRIGLAKSRDGLTFRKNDIPVLYPDNDANRTFEWEGGCEDPRIVRREDGLFVMTYTAYDGKIARLCVASSNDMITWKKHGLVLSDRRYRDTWSKSGAIVCEIERDGDIEARKIRGKYWMYWGDSQLFMATSDDLITWTPVEARRGKLKAVMKPRNDYFDSKLVEPGPLALLTRDGILLLYNSANDAKKGDPTLPNMAYAVGQALFSARKPDKLIARAEKPSLFPEKAYEREGQVNNVVFLEGLVWFKDRWLLYYGGADSRVGVAECRKKLSDVR